MNYQDLTPCAAFACISSVGGCFGPEKVTVPVVRSDRDRIRNSVSPGPGFAANANINFVFETNRTFCPNYLHIRRRTDSAWARCNFVRLDIRSLQYAPGAADLSLFVSRLGVVSCDPVLKLPTTRDLFRTCRYREKSMIGESPNLRLDQTAPSFWS